MYVNIYRDVFDTIISEEIIYIYLKGRMVCATLPVCLLKCDLLFVMSGFFMAYTDLQCASGICLDDPGYFLLHRGLSAVDHFSLESLGLGSAVSGKVSDLLACLACHVFVYTFQAYLYRCIDGSS